MQLLLWYKDLDEVGVAQAMMERLQACGFLVAGLGADPWESVRLCAAKVCHIFTVLVESHVCADLCLPPGNAASTLYPVRSFLCV